MTIKELFTKKKGKIISVYFTAGFPDLPSLPKIISELESAGADLIEIGIPFSDPVADGPVIQESNKLALDGSASLKKIFAELKKLPSSTTIPIVLMSYLNPLLAFGLENVCEQCKECKISQMIIPDLPVEEYKSEYKDLFTRFDIGISFLVTPITTDKRIRLLDQETNGFLYAVSSPGVTGAGRGQGDTLSGYLQKLNSLNLKNPYLVGFGIKSKEDLDLVNSLEGAGVIIGSRFIEVLKSEGIAGIKPFIHSLR